MIHSRPTRGAVAALAALACSWAGGAAAQEEGEKPPFRTRITLGAQLAPSFPGSRKDVLGPNPDIDRTRGDTPFDFEAPDESSGFVLWSGGGFTVGPALNFQASRTAKDVGVALPKVGFTIEPGGYLQYQVVDSVRVRTEVRKGLGGHRGWIGVVSADYIARDRDRWLFSIGPRLTLSDDRYNRAFFGVAPADAPAAGLASFTAKGGAQAVGASTGILRQFGPRWGVAGFAQYNRLVGDPARSPIVQTLGSRNQYSGGLALSYIFGRID